MNKSHYTLNTTAKYVRYSGAFLLLLVVVALSLRVAHAPRRPLGFSFLGMPDAATAFGVTNGSLLQRFGITNGTHLESFGVTNGSSLVVDYTACAPQMKSNGVWLEVQLPTPGFVTTLPAGHGTLAARQAGTLVITAPPHGAAWRLPVAWGYRLTKLQLLKNRSENLLAGLLHPGAAPRAIYSDVYTNYSVEINASPSRPTRMRGRQRARVKPLHIPNRSAGRAAYLAFLLGESSAILQIHDNFDVGNVLDKSS